MIYVESCCACSLFSIRYFDRLFISLASWYLVYSLLLSRLLDKRFYTPFCTLYVRLFRRSYLVLDTCLISGNIHYFCIVFKLWNCNEQLLNE